MEFIHVLENGDIRLTPKDFVNKAGPSGIKITNVTLSHTGFAFRWIIDFLEGKEGIQDEYEDNGKKYKALKSSEDLFFQEYRSNNISIVGFSSKEIHFVLAELKKVIM